jgi:hypothetical protein
VSNSQTEIVINLDDYDSNLDIEPKNLIHQKVYDNLRRDIAASLLNTRQPVSLTDGLSKASTEGRYPPGSGLVYFVDGSRGAGKTTFLRTVYKSLPDALRSNQPKEEKTISLVALDYIDPTRLEGSEIILLNILRSLKQIVEASSPCLKDEPHQENFRRHFKKLAGGLSLFRNGHDQLAHHDPELFFDRGLARAEDSRSLRSSLHCAIDTACLILGADALLLAFDDADTNAQHAYPLLECIRNYLDTPRLIIVATGDMELYSLLVREQFSRQLPIAKDAPDKGRQAQHSRMLDHLESQYLLKLFPLPRRYHLKTLGRLLEDKEQTSYRFCFNSWGGNKRAPLDVLNEIIRRGLRVRVQSDVDLFREHLLRQPLRSVLQVLLRCAPSISNADEVGKNNVSWNRDLSDALRQALRAMAQGSLYKKGIVVDDLVADYLPALTKAVFELACEDGDVDTAAYLRPQASDEDLNNCYIALAAEVAGLCAANPSAALTYLLAGPGSVSLWGKEKRRKASKISPELLARQFKQYMAIGRDEDALNWARRATAVLAASHPAQPKAPVVDFGIIGLNKRKPDEAKGNVAKNFEVIESVLRKLGNQDKGLPTFAYSLLDVSNESSRCYASIYNILGLIERFWRADKEEISRCLRGTYPQLSISSPDWGESIDSDVDGLLESDEDDDSNSKTSDEAEMSTEPEIHFGNLPGAILNWQKMHQKRFEMHAPSSILLGKIWVRIYFSLEKSSDASRPGRLDKGKGAADIMELSAACLINAFLVEEAAHGVLKCKGKLESTNPLTSASKNLKSKMEFLEENINNLPLTHAIASCPLVLGLLGDQARNPVIKALSLDAHVNGAPYDSVQKAFIAGRWRSEGKR